MPNETTAHTPGPWIWRWKSSSLHQVGQEPYTYGETVLQLVGDDEGAALISDADDALIAAAPDLLAALKEIVRISDRKHDAWDAAHAAIAKAEGNADV